jgi:hypothetical protein
VRDSQDIETVREREIKQVCELSRIRSLIRQGPSSQALEHPLPGAVETSPRATEAAVVAGSLARHSHVRTTPAEWRI